MPKDRRKGDGLDRKKNGKETHNPFPEKKPERKKNVGKTTDEYKNLITPVDGRSPYAI